MRTLSRPPSNPSLLKALLLASSLLSTPAITTAEPPALEPAPTKPAAQFAANRPANAETIITALESASFDNKTGLAEFTGSVTVKDPQFTLTCDRLKAYLSKDRKGLEKIEAIGNVVIRQENRDDRGQTTVSTAKAALAAFFPATGEVELSGWPQITQGINAHVATEESTKIILNRAGRITTTGGSRTMIVDTGQTVP